MNLTISAGTGDKGEVEESLEADDDDDLDSVRTPDMKSFQLPLS